MGCEGIEWIITFQHYRRINPLPLVNVDNLKKYSYLSIGNEVLRLVESSPPIRGTFMFKYKNLTTNELSYDAPPSLVREELKFFTFMSPFIEVTRTGNPDNGCAWILTFNEMNDMASTMRSIQVYVLSYMTGGSKRSTGMETNTVRYASKNQFFEGLPFFMLHTKHEKPQIIVKINDIYAGCPENICDYTFLPDSSLPYLDSFKFFENGLMLNVNNSSPPQSLILMDEYQTIFAESQCKTAGYIYTKNSRELSISCVINKNPDGTFMLVAGSYIPIVFLKGVGYLPSKVPKDKEITIKLSISSISTSQVKFYIKRFECFSLG